MSDNGGSRDDQITPVTTPIKNPANRELAAVVADLVLAARQRTTGLRHLYVQICLMDGVVPRSWGMKLIEEEEANNERDRQQLVHLRSVLV